MGWHLLPKDSLAHQSSPLRIIGVSRAADLLKDLPSQVGATTGGLVSYGRTSLMGTL